MATWTVLNFSALEVLAAAKMNQLVANLSALAEQAAGAPHIEYGFREVAHATFTDTVSITSLVGNTDKIWLLIFNTYHAVAAGPGLRFNNDAAGNYEIAFDRINEAGSGYGATIGANQINLVGGALKSNCVRALINAKSGIIRSVSFEAFGVADNNDYSLSHGIGIWDNAGDEIIRLDIVSVVNAIGAGEYWLYKLYNS